MFVEETVSESSQKLKRKREALGLSLGDVYAKIRVRTNYLQYIENGEFHLLPDPVFTRGFIRAYARFLGVDEEPVLKDYEAYLNALRSKLTSKKTSEEDAFFASFWGQKKYWRLGLIVLMILLVGLVLRLVTPKSEEIELTKETVGPAAPAPHQALHASPGMTPANLPPEGVVPPKGNAPGAETGNAVPPGSGENNVRQSPAPHLPGSSPAVSGQGQQKSLLITASEETWIRVKAGDKPPVQVLLRPGERFESPEKNFYLDIGNAGGIKIQYLGKEVENIGKPGEVVHLKLPR